MYTIHGGDCKIKSFINPHTNLIFMSALGRVMLDSYALDPLLDLASMTNLNTKKCQAWAKGSPFPSCI